MVISPIAVAVVVVGGSGGSVGLSLRPGVPGRAKESEEEELAVALAAAAAAAALLGDWRARVTGPLWLCWM